MSPAVVVPAAPAVEHLHHRGLAGPVGPQQAEARTLLDLEADVADRGQLAEVLADVLTEITAIRPLILTWTESVIVPVGTDKNRANPGFGVLPASATAV